MIKLDIETAVAFVEARYAHHLPTIKVRWSQNAGDGTQIISAEAEAGFAAARDFQAEYGVSFRDYLQANLPKM